MKTFRIPDPDRAEDLVLLLRQMGYVAHRSGFTSVDAYVRADRGTSRVMFADLAKKSHEPRDEARA